MKISRTSIGLAVRAARQAARISLTELAKKTDINVSALSRVESGIRSLEFAEAVSLAEELHVDLDHFRDLASTYEKSGVLEKIVKNKKLIDELRQAHQQAILTAIEAGA